MSPTNRVTAPIIEPGSKVGGPASYFPSIETTYGRPMQEWVDLVTSQWTAGSHVGGQVQCAAMVPLPSRVALHECGRRTR
ncbi:MAG TPA: DUF4287 domain-containing protein [Ilumatobacteraceae bacterium]|nr:DUF4287 domain-containing protein [Ilumatobacteraceae bacterium]